MPLISSPIAYPTSLSPPKALESRKRSLDSCSSYPAKRRSLGSNGIDTGNPQLIRHDTVMNISTDPGILPTVSLQRKGPFVDDDNEEDPISNESGVRVLLTTEKENLALDQSSILGHENKNIEGALIQAISSTGKTFLIGGKVKAKPISYGKMIAARSTTASGRATKSFYGVNVHSLLDQAVKENRQNAKKFPLNHLESAPHTSIEGPNLSKVAQKRSNMPWTERYRARKFTDLVGDERTHRDVLRWIKHWDPIVFPGAAKPTLKKTLKGDEQEEKQHRKLLLLTGPPGLGKTTLAHVCARQAGYEAVEINASDDRTSQFVKGRIRDCVSTETVKGSHTNTEQGKVRKAGRPVCIVVDEVDGVAGGNNNSVENGFIKALIDLVALDQNNSSSPASSSGNWANSRKKRDKFRLLRPIILICNDIYHSSLRPLRTSSTVEIIHIRKPPLDKVIARLKSVFEKEGIACDGDGVRKLCEATWGVTNKKEGQSQIGGEGDMRGIFVVGEWAAAQLRASSKASVRLTRKWVEDNMTEGLSYGGQGSRGVGRGSAKEAVARVFTDGGGFKKATFSSPIQDPLSTKADGVLSVSEASKKSAMDRLREMIDASGESDRIMTDCFTSYPSQPFQDDTFLSKPNAACDWLHFHDLLSSKVHAEQEWELSSYLSHSILGFHHLFASSARQAWSDQKPWDEDADEEPKPFSGPKADYEASEKLKQNKSIFQGLQSSLTIPLIRSFRSEEVLSTDLLPHLLKVLAPNVKPITVGGSGEQASIANVRKEGERRMIERIVGIMDAVGVVFERVRVESSQTRPSSYIYRMQP